MLTSYCFCGAQGRNSLVRGVCQVKWCYAWRQTHSWLPKCRASLKIRLCPMVRLEELTSFMVCSLLSVHMMIWWCRPWFGSTWSGFERCDLAWLGPVGHFISEFETILHIIATDLRKNPLLAFE